MPRETTPDPVLDPVPVRRRSSLDVVFDVTTEKRRVIRFDCSTATVDKVITVRCVSREAWAGLGTGQAARSHSRPRDRTVAPSQPPHPRCRMSCK